MEGTMRRAFSSGVRQANTAKFYISVFLTILLIFAGSTKDLIRALREHALLPAGFGITFLKNALTTDAVVSFLPIIAVLPFSGVYVNDIKSMFSRFCLIRSNYRDYLWSRFWVCFITGGGAILLGVLLSWGLSALLFLPMEKAAEKGAVSDIQLFPLFSLFFFSGGLWAVLGMTMSTIMESKYIAYASPFIVYYLLVILYERYFPDAWLLYPKNWLNPEIWPYGIGSAVLFLLELTFLCGLVFYVRGKRRLEQL